MADKCKMAFAEWFATLSISDLVEYESAWTGYQAAWNATRDGGEVVAWQYRECRHPNGTMLPEKEINANSWQHADDNRVAEIRSLPAEQCRFELRPLHTQPVGVTEDMVLRACNAYDNTKTHTYETEPETEYPAMYAALQAALQKGGG
jgi:hypothetical protein